MKNLDVQKSGESAAVADPAVNTQSPAAEPAAAESSAAAIAPEPVVAEAPIVEAPAPASLEERVAAIERKLARHGICHE